MADYLDQLKYITEWNPKAYLASIFCDPIKFNAELKQTVDFYSSFSNDSLTVLDYSGGPSLLRMLIAAPKASKIIFSDFLKQNREEVKIWLNDDFGAFDWKPAIKHCLNLEGGADDAVNIYKRESMLREKINAVIPCDFTSDNFIEGGYEGPYDVVSCTGVLDAICQTKEQFIECIKKLSTLVRVGGYLIITTDDSESYNVSETEFVTPFYLTDDEIQEIFLAAGISEVSFKTIMTFDEAVLSIGHKA